MKKTNNVHVKKALAAFLSLSAAAILIPAQAQAAPAQFAESVKTKVAAAAAEAGADTGTIYVANVEEYLSVFEDQTTDSKIMGRLYRGAAAYVVKSEGDWSYINSGSVSGWVSNRYLAMGEEAQQLLTVINPRVASTKAVTLNVRSDADVDSTVITQVEEGTELVVTGSTDEWWRVRLTNDTVGYISKEYAEVETGLYMAVDSSSESVMADDLNERKEERAAAKAAAEKKAEEKTQEAETAKKTSSSSEKTSSNSTSSGSTSSGNNATVSTSSAASSSSAKYDDDEEETEAAVVDNDDDEEENDIVEGEENNSASADDEDEILYDVDEEVEEEKEASSGWVSLGTFKTTAYCTCSKCNGSNAGKTATGATPVVGTTVAVDRSVIPLGSKIMIDGHVYIAQDTGVSGKTVDILMSTHSGCYDYGVVYKEVYIYRG